MKEFSQYGKHMNLVKNMVSRDKPEYAVNKFYTCLSNDIKVLYIKNIKQAIKLIKEDTQKSLIIATTIAISPYDNKDKICNHAITLVKENNNVYLFDPNGIVNDKSYYLYNIDENLFTTKQLNLYLNKLYDIKLKYQNNKGIQYYGPSEENTNFIKSGGYCMFYNYWFIQFLTTNWNNDIDMIKYIIKNINIRYTKKINGIFPSNNEIDISSLKVIQQIFN